MGCGASSDAALPGVPSPAPRVVAVQGFRPRVAPAADVHGVVGVGVSECECAGALVGSVSGESLSAARKQLLSKERQAAVAQRDLLETCTAPMTHQQRGGHAAANNPDRLTPPVSTGVKLPFLVVPGPTSPPESGSGGSGAGGESSRNTSSRVSSSRTASFGGVSVVGCGASLLSTEVESWSSMLPSGLKSDPTSPLVKLPRCIAAAVPPMTTRLPSRERARDTRTLTRTSSADAAHPGHQQAAAAAAAAAASHHQAGHPTHHPHRSTSAVEHSGVRDSSFSRSGQKVVGAMPPVHHPAARPESHHHHQPLKKKQLPPQQLEALVAPPSAAASLLAHTHEDDSSVGVPLPLPHPHHTRPHLAHTATGRSRQLSNSRSANERHPHHAHQPMHTRPSHQDTQPAHGADATGGAHLGGARQSADQAHDAPTQAQEKQEEHPSKRAQSHTQQPAAASSSSSVAPSSHDPELPIQDIETYSRLYHMYNESSEEYQQYKLEWEREQKRMREEREAKEQPNAPEYSRSLYTPDPGVRCSSGGATTPLHLQTPCRTPQPSLSPMHGRTMSRSLGVVSPVPGDLRGGGLEGGTLIADGTALCLLVESSRPASVCSSPVPGYKLLRMASPPMATTPAGAYYGLGLIDESAGGYVAGGGSGLGGTWSGSSSPNPLSPRFDESVTGVGGRTSAAPQEAQFGSHAGSPLSTSASVDQARAIVQLREQLIVHQFQQQQHRKAVAMHMQMVAMSKQQQQQQLQQQQQQHQSSLSASVKEDDDAELLAISRDRAATPSSSVSASVLNTPQRPPSSGVAPVSGTRAAKRLVVSAAPPTPLGLMVAHSPHLALAPNSPAQVHFTVMTPTGGPNKQQPPPAHPPQPTTDTITSPNANRRKKLVMLANESPA